MAYGLAQRCALVTLAMKGGEADNTALVLKKPDRDKLVSDRVITVDKGKRPMALRLTDRGWQAVEDEMVAEPPPRAGTAGPALYATLHALSALLSRENRSPREAFGLGPPTTEAPPDDPEAKVRHAYQRLATKKREWVELSHLRAALGSMSREDTDSALIHMLNAKQLEMTAHEDQARLTKAQRAAALKVGRMNMHLVSLFS